MKEDGLMDAIVTNKWVKLTDGECIVYPGKAVSLVMPEAEIYCMLQAAIFVPQARYRILPTFTVSHDWQIC